MEEGQIIDGHRVKPPIRRWMVAAIIGLSVPIVLEKTGHDPALGSSIITTATTDSMGFLIFLGLASIFLI